jgi:hypothetical protein
MMEDNERKARQQARLNKSAEERWIGAIEDIADALFDIKDELMQIRVRMMVEPQLIEPRPTQR